MASSHMLANNEERIERIPTDRTFYSRISNGGSLHTIGCDFSGEPDCIIVVKIRKYGNHTAHVECSTGVFPLPNDGAPQTEELGPLVEYYKMRLAVGIELKK